MKSAGVRTKYQSRGVGTRRCGWSGSSSLDRSVGVPKLDVDAPESGSERPGSSASKPLSDFTTDMADAATDPAPTRAIFASSPAAAFPVAWACFFAFACAFAVAFASS